MRYKNLLFAALIGMLTLSACSKKSLDGRSETGLLPEEFIPEDVSIVLSYSLLDKQQFEAMEALADRFDFEEVVQDFSQTQLSVELDFEEAFGKQFRMVTSMRSAEGADEMDTFMVYTLSKPAALQSQLNDMADAGDFTKKRLSSVEAYVQEDEQMYMAIQDDLLFMANSAENLVEMVSLKAKDSLVNNEAYEKINESLDEEQIFVGMMLNSPDSTDPEAALPSLMDYQMLAIRVEEDGFKLLSRSKLDADSLAEGKANGIDIKYGPAYLFKEVPSAALVAYFEGSALGKSLLSSEEAMKQLEAYLGSDPEEELLSFLDKGMAVSLHKNSEGAFPGASLFVDVSSDPEAAAAALEKFEVQVSNIKAFIESFLPGAAEESTIEIAGKPFKTLRVNLAKMDSDAASPILLPAALAETVIQLSYGMYEDRLLITTSDVWSQEMEESIADSDLYKKLSKKMDVNEGLILLDAEGISAYLDELEVLSTALGLNSGDEAVSQNVQDLLAEFLGGILSGKSKGLEAEFSGFLLLK